eukprot:12341943-Alexandrium_andersonii.AAC.1
MSASLVGSEMCIRDRLAGLRRIADCTLEALDCRDWRHPNAPTAELNSACLLYTSDAADDM